MQTVTDPREVIAFLKKKENREIFGADRCVTGFFSPDGDRHGVCVQLRQFFGRTFQGVTLHYEIEEYKRGISVEIHSEVGTPQKIHEFIRKQFDVKPKGRQGAFRFATIRVDWKGRLLDDVVEEIKGAVDKLYRKYDAYFNYVEGYFAGKGNVTGCKLYKDFMCEIASC